jgi:lysophospholipase L1-like esterase
MPTPAAYPINVVCLGDSLTNGSYPQDMQAILRRSFSLRSWNVKALGICGSNTQEWMQMHLHGNARRQLAAGGVDVYVLLLGTNDALKTLPFSGEMFHQRLEQITQTLLDEHVPVILISPPPVGPGDYAKYIDATLISNDIREICAQVADELRCGFVDGFSVFGGTRPSASSYIDGVHLSPSGNRMLANAVAKHVGEAISTSGNEDMDSDDEHSEQGMPESWFSDLMQDVRQILQVS